VTARRGTALCQALCRGARADSHVARGSERLWAISQCAAAEDRHRHGIMRGAGLELRFANHDKVGLILFTDHIEKFLPAAKGADAMSCALFGKCCTSSPSGGGPMWDGPWLISIASAGVVQ